jgi:hypothetical protein
MVEQNFTSLLRDYPSIINEKKKFAGLVKDMLPGQPLQTNLLLTLYDIGIHTEIAAATAVTNTFAFRFVKQLVDEHGVSRINADWAVSVWCVCYGRNILGKPCEIKISAAKSGGIPSIAEEKSGGRQQYQDLFRFKKSRSGQGYAITGFTGENKRTLIFPSSHTGNPVTAIAEGAFSECEAREAVMTDGITVIETKAFSGCAKLKQVIFPETLLEIGDFAFSGCGELTTAMLPSRLERIGAYAFASSGVKTVDFPKDLNRLGEGAYSHCPGITVISIPHAMESISDKLFEGCTALKKITLPETLLSIGAFAFAGCNRLAFLSVPDTVTDIGESAFQNVDAKFILQCAPGSAAEQYARKYKLNFQLH